MDFDFLYLVVNIYGVGRVAVVSEYLYCERNSLWLHGSRRLFMITMLSDSEVNSSVKAKILPLGRVFFFFFFFFLWWDAGCHGRALGLL
jgi:hypothetical protein